MDATGAAQIKLDVEDLSRTQLYLQLGIGAAMLMAWPFLGPAASVGSGIVGGLVTRKVLGKKRDEQKRQLVPAVEDAIGKALHAGVSSARDRLRSIYRQIMDESRRQETIWSETRRKALVVGDSEAADVERENLATRSREADELIAALTPWTEGRDQ